jgi:hypothetical protein
MISLIHVPHMLIKQLIGRRRSEITSRTLSMLPVRWVCHIS